MPRPAALPRAPRPRSVCRLYQVYDSISTQPVRPATASIFHTPNVSRPQTRIRQIFCAQTLHGRRLFSSTTPSNSSSPASLAKGSSAGQDARTPAPEGQSLVSITNMMAYVETHSSKVLTHRSIPSEAEVAAALGACKLVADYIMDDSVQPQVSHMVTELESTASNLLSLDATNQGHMAPETLGSAGIKISAQLRQMINKISDTAYATLLYPPVFISPSLLQLYVDVQARLGKPESLPQIFHLYASKPMPREAAGSLSYVKQSPGKVANAITPKTIETALDVAIEAKNLDAAIGIIENSYKTKAFIRNKLLRQAVIPAGGVAATPLAAYALATGFSELQQAMDSTTATNVAFAGILAYVGFTASIGLVALMTANDQMRRVTWAPGVPLRNRWLREEERAALDKVACAWGFQEEWRQGEEEGADWDALREYIGQRGMILDRTELMEGMN